MVHFSHLLRMGLLGWGALASPALQAQGVPVPQPPAASALAPPAAADAVLDPAAPVPAIRYRSVFGHAPTGVESTEVDWRRANDDVGQFRRGHIDILKWESQHEGKH
jgi:hypothetical protein